MQEPRNQSTPGDRVNTHTAARSLHWEVNRKQKLHGDDRDEIDGQRRLFFVCVCAPTHAPLLFNLQTTTTAKGERERAFASDSVVFFFFREPKEEEEEGTRDNFEHKRKPSLTPSLSFLVFIYLFFFALHLFSSSWRPLSPEDLQKKRTEKIRHYKARKWRPLSIDIVHFIYLFHHSFRILFIYIYITFVLYNLIYS